MTNIKRFLLSCKIRSTFLHRSKTFYNKKKPDNQPAKKCETDKQ